MIRHITSWWDPLCASCRALRLCASRALVVIWILLSLYGVGVIAYWALWQRDLLLVHGGVAVTATVQPGGVLRIVWDLSKKATSDQCSGTLHRYVTGTTQQKRWHDFGDFHVNEYAHIIGDHLPVPVEMQLPPDIEPGVWFYQTMLEYRCDPLDSVWPEAVQFPSIPFRVTP